MFRIQPKKCTWGPTKSALGGLQKVHKTIQTESPSPRSHDALNDTHNEEMLNLNLIVCEIKLSATKYKTVSILGGLKKNKWQMAQHGM